MTTADHIAAVEEAITAAGGPDNIRFAPVSKELAEATAPIGPVEVRICPNSRTGLVDVIFSEIDEQVSDLASAALAALVPVVSNAAAMLKNGRDPLAIARQLDGILGRLPELAGDGS